jgi:hypothetical protein
MQLVHVACGEKQLEGRRVRDTILPEQEHAWNTGVLLKKCRRQCSDGRIAESILRKVKAVQENVHAGVLRAKLAHDLRQSIANFQNILGRHEAPAGHINRDARGPATTSNTHAIRIHGDRVGTHRDEWVRHLSSRSKLQLTSWS